MISSLWSEELPEQADETWLAQFKSKISTDWDFTAIHINKNSIAGVKKDIVCSKNLTPHWIGCDSSHRTITGTSMGNLFG